MREIPKIVCSKALQRADWPETGIARGELSEEIGRLKREPGKDPIACGGATFDQALSRLGLVDEYRLMGQAARSEHRGKPGEDERDTLEARMSHRRGTRRTAH